MYTCEAVNSQGSAMINITIVVECKYNNNQHVGRALDGLYISLALSIETGVLSLLSSRWINSGSSNKINGRDYMMTIDYLCN